MAAKHFTSDSLHGTVRKLFFEPTYIVRRATARVQWPRESSISVTYSNFWLTCIPRRASVACYKKLTCFQLYLLSQGHRDQGRGRGSKGRKKGGDKCHPKSDPKTCDRMIETAFARRWLLVDCVLQQAVLAASGVCVQQAECARNKRGRTVPKHD